MSRLMMAVNAICNPLLSSRIQLNSMQSGTRNCRSRSSESSPTAPRLPDSDFWRSKAVWKRAAVNTSRCLVGCTLGDFSAMFYLQSAYPALPLTTTMAFSSESTHFPNQPPSSDNSSLILPLTQPVSAGLMTSFALETLFLKLGKDQMQWRTAAKTAANMSLVSMLAMEAAENVVDYALTGGVVALSSPAFWLAGFVSMAAGFLVPLPYNYVKLRRYGRACH